MQGGEEVLIATNAMKFETKNSKQFKIIAGESEYVSSAHITQLDTSKNDTDYYNQEQDSSDCADLGIITMHANQSDPLPRGNDAHMINSFKDIAKTTGHTSQIMNFPPIDHDSPTW